MSKNWRQGDDVGLHVKSVPPISPDAIREVAGNALRRALLGIPEAASITKSVAEDRLNEYVNISKLDGAHVGGEYGKGWLSDTIISGYEEQDENGILTKASWVRSSCICLDEACSETGAVDIEGVRNMNLTFMRGYGPILLYDDHGTYTPCLGARRFSFSEVHVEGCEPDKYPRIDYCDVEPLDSLRLYDSHSNFIGRALNGSEVFPVVYGVSDIEADLPKMTVVDVIDYKLEKNGKSKPKVDLNLFNINTWSPWLDYNFIESMKGLVQILLGGLGNTFLPYSFNDDVGHLGETRIEEILRVSYSFTKRKLENSLDTPKNVIHERLRSSPLYRNIMNEIPETSPLQEIISGAVLLSITASAFGYTAGKLRELKFSRPRSRKENLDLTLPFLVSLLVVVAEACAYSVRWMAETNQDSYQKSMILVDVVGGGRY